MSEKMIEKMINKDIMTIIQKIKKCHSKSQYNLLLKDLMELYSLSEMLNIVNIPNIDDYSFKSYIYDENKNIKHLKMYYINNYNYNFDLADNYLNLIKNYLPYEYNYKLTKINIKENEEIVLDFFNKLKKERILKNLLKDNRIIYLNKPEQNIDSEGITFYPRNEYMPYILIDDYNTIFTSLTLVHEVGHIIDFKSSYNEKNNYSREIYSHFLELIYTDYLKENNITYKEIKYDYFDNLREVLEDYLKILELNLKTNEEFRINYQNIYYTIEYLYGMVLALHFYDEYKNDKERGMYLIEEFIKNKNNYNTLNNILNIFNKDIILEGKKLEKELIITNSIINR